MRPFLRFKNPAAAKNAANRIIQTIDILADQPDVGRSTEDSNTRELVVSSGRDGYVVLCHYAAEEVVILAIRHGRENGYK